MNITDALAEAMMTDVPCNMSPYEAAKDCFDDAIEYVEGLEIDNKKLNHAIDYQHDFLTKRGEENKQLLAELDAEKTHNAILVESMTVAFDKVEQLLARVAELEKENSQMCRDHNSRNFLTPTKAS